MWNLNKLNPWRKSASQRFKEMKENTMDASNQFSEVAQGVVKKSEEALREHDARAASRAADIDRMEEREKALGIERDAGNRVVKRPGEKDADTRQSVKEAEVTIKNVDEKLE